VKKNEKGVVGLDRLWRTTDETGGNTMIENRKYSELFFEEADEHLQSLN